MLFEVQTSTLQLVEQEKRSSWRSAYITTLWAALKRYISFSGTCWYDVWACMALANLLDCNGLFPAEQESGSLRFKPALLFTPSDATSTVPDYNTVWLISGETWRTAWQLSSAKYKMTLRTVIRCPHRVMGFSGLFWACKGKVVKYWTKLYYIHRTHLKRTKHWWCIVFLL